MRGFYCFYPQCLVASNPLKDKKKSSESSKGIRTWLPSQQCVRFWYFITLGLMGQIHDGSEALVFVICLLIVNVPVPGEHFHCVNCCCF